MSDRTQSTHRGTFVEAVVKNLQCFHDDQTSDHGIRRRYCRYYVASHRWIHKKLVGKLA